MYNYLVSLRNRHFNAANGDKQLDLGVPYRIYEIYEENIYNVAN